MNRLKRTIKIKIRQDDCLNYSMKIIFLDVDGVLNNATTTEQKHGITGIDHRLVPVLKRLLDESQAKVVISSTWRLFKSKRIEIVRLIKQLGHETIGVTPRLFADRDWETNL